jgi:hypothetical protein
MLINTFFEVLFIATSKNFDVAFLTKLITPQKLPIFLY